MVKLNIIEDLKIAVKTFESMSVRNKNLIRLK